MLIATIIAGFLIAALGLETLMSSPKPIEPRKPKG
jgi:hypothetical protein